MDNVTISIDVPKDVLFAANITEANASANIKKLLALLMFKERILSFGKAAELSGLDALSFLSLLGSHRVTLNYDVDDFQDDVETIRSLGL